jgi:hypothetical protein
LRGRAEQAEQQTDAYRAELDRLRAATVDADTTVAQASQSLESA